VWLLPDLEGRGMNGLRLTHKEWEIVNEQCLKCKLWDEDEGCIYEGRANNLPVEDCNIFEENKK